MNIPPETKPIEPPQVLDLALSQIADLLKTSGDASLGELLKAKDGYAQIIWLLEKLSKASLEWREHQNGTKTEGTPGTSPATEEKVERIFER